LRIAESTLALGDIGYRSSEFFLPLNRTKKITLYPKKYRAKLKNFLGNFSPTFQPRMEKILARNEMKISLVSFSLSAEGFF
jgi:hypothetical protein